MIYFNEGNEIKFCVALSHGSTHFYAFRKAGRELLSAGEVLAEERSLLYCCHLFRNKAAAHATNVFLAGGGVQNEVLIWDVAAPEQPGARARTLAKLNGHKGAIFGIHANWQDGLLLTTGDDRNVVLWRAASALSCDENSLDNVEWRISRVLVGHDARVWGGMSLPNDDSVIAWGEDCSVRLWGRDGAQRGCISPHTGRSVWAADVRITADKYLLATGGNDGAVVVSELPRSEEKGESETFELDDELDFPRRLVAMQSGEVLVVSDLGRFFLARRAAVGRRSSLTRIRSDIEEDLVKHYCFICEYEAGRGTLLLGNMFGRLTLARLEQFGGQLEDQMRDQMRDQLEDQPEDQLEDQPEHQMRDQLEHQMRDQQALAFRICTLQTFELSQKIMAIGRTPTDVLISLSSGQMVSLTDNAGVLSTRDHVSLTSGWAACWVQWQSVINGETHTHFVCGDRDGRLHYFEIKYSSEMRLSVVAAKTRKLACKSGITCLAWHEKQQRIYAGNKSGEVCSLEGYSLDRDIVVLRNADVLGWTCRLDMIDIDGDGLLITGFKSTLFRRVVVHGSGQHPVVLMEQACGGGHREWDIHTSQSHVDQLAFIQSRAVNVVSWASRCARPVVVKPHLHGKEINFCSFVENSDQMVLLSGSEDCSLALVLLDRQNDEYALSTVKRIHGHISSVRCVTQLEDLMVSAGGRGQIIFWSVDNKHRSMRVVASRLLPKLINSHTDIRIMDMCQVVHGEDSMVGIAGSDGRLLFVSLPKNSVRPKFEMEYRVSNSCISNVSYVRSLLICCSTDGKVHWFPFSRNPERHKSYQLGRSALLGMDTYSGSCDSIAVSVGGDDGSVTIVSFELNNLEWNLKGHAQYLLAHSGSTVSTRWLIDNDSMRLASLGSDGRLILWKANFHAEFVELLMIRCISSCVGVTDPHTMAVTKHAFIKSRFWFYVVGMGAHLFDFDLGCDE